MTAMFPDLVKAELAEATAKFGAIHSTHEAYSIIKEELDEFWDEVKRNGTPVDLIRELVQVAAMCQRAAEDLWLADKVTP